MFNGYDTVRFLAFDPAMKNMGVTSFVLKNSLVDDIIDGIDSSDSNDDIDDIDDIDDTDDVEGINLTPTTLEKIVEAAMKMEYSARVDLGIELTETYIDVLNITMAVNSFLENLVSTIITTPVGTTAILIEKQPDSNFATTKIYDAILAFFCNPKYRNILLPRPEVESTVLDNIMGVTTNYTMGKIPPITPLGYTALIPLDGYAKNDLTLYSTSSLKTGVKETSSKYLLNKHETKIIFRKYCENIGVKVGSRTKLDDMADSFCMTIFVLRKLLSY
jgi:hypothetical protein